MSVPRSDARRPGGQEGPIPEMSWLLTDKAAPTPGVVLAAGPARSSTRRKQSPGSPSPPLIAHVARHQLIAPPTCPMKVAQSPARPVKTGNLTPHQAPRFCRVEGPSSRTSLRCPIQQRSAPPHTQRTLSPRHAHSMTVPISAHAHLEEPHTPHCVSLEENSQLHALLAQMEDRQMARLNAMESRWMLRVEGLEKQLEHWRHEAASQVDTITDNVLERVKTDECICHMREQQKLVKETMQASVAMMQLLQASPAALPLASVEHFKQQLEKPACNRAYEPETTGADAEHPDIACLPPDTPSAQVTSTNVHLSSSSSCRFESGKDQQEMSVASEACPTLPESPRVHCGDLVVLENGVPQEYRGCPAVVTKTAESHCTVTVLDSHRRFGIGECWPDLQHISAESYKLRLGTRVVIHGCSGAQTKHLNGLAGVISAHPKEGHPVFIRKQACPDKPLLSVCVLFEDTTAAKVKSALLEARFIVPYDEVALQATKQLTDAVEAMSKK